MVLAIQGFYYTNILINSSLFLLLIAAIIATASSLFTIVFATLWILTASILTCWIIVLLRRGALIELLLLWVTWMPSCSLCVAAGWLISSTLAVGAVATVPSASLITLMGASIVACLLILIPSIASTACTILVVVAVVALPVAAT